MTINGNNFQSVYQPFNTHGGPNVLGFALDARDVTVDSIILDTNNKNRYVKKILFSDASIKYSASGYYTFKMQGELEYSDNYVTIELVDITNMVDEAFQRAKNNMVVGMILSPETTLFKYSLMKNYKSKYTYHQKD